MAKGDRKVEGLRFLQRETENYWNVKEHLRPASWWVSKKLDGVFGHIERGSGMVSREGNRFPGLERVERACQHIFNLWPSITHLQGELWHPEWDFSKISSVVKSGTVPVEEKGQLEFHVFLSGGFAPAEVEDMRNWLYHTLIGHRSVRPVHIWPIKDTQVERLLAQVVEEGYEGLVLRRTDGNDRQRMTYYKVKPFKEMDLRVVGYEEGKGHIKGMLGKLDCAGTDPDSGKTIRVEVGSGFDKAGHRWARKELWEQQEQLIGRIVEVRYDYLTQARNSATLSMRFPRFIKFKEDR